MIESEGEWQRKMRVDESENSEDEKENGMLNEELERRI